MTESERCARAAGRVAVPFAPRAPQSGRCHPSSRAVFLLVGILGFISRITTNYGDISFAGEDSGAELLGLFQVSVLHKIVHLPFGSSASWRRERGNRTLASREYAATQRRGVTKGEE